ncbi:CYP3A4 [Cordylochernes scorpioides]|uniref:CYP3A4 n=1 Tax=Cordylochernes scorpioides TaxID=51811 RepID=A0ABY6LN04_9ARAC|nr:CYP3A4 [Cordylochernes scorpioides]
MAHLINECADVTCKNFAEIAATKKPYNVKRIFGAFTMDVIATTAFGTKLDSHHDPDNPFVKHAQKVFNQEFNIAVILLFLFPRLFKLFGKTIFDKAVMDFFRGLTERLIKERKENPEVKRYDLLQMMLDELDDEDLPNGSSPGDVNVKGLTKNEILANAILFFIAGYETTASTLSHCAYLLALNPECQDRLAAEVTRAGRDVSLDYDSVKNMPYLEAVVAETLRMYPPASRTERESVEAYKLGDTGIEIPKGMLIQIPVHAIHHCPDFHPDPEKFDPERFLPENKDNIRPFTYLPFGEGPRNCVAERFAQLEVKLCLAKAIQKFSFHRVPETKVSWGRRNLSPLLYFCITLVPLTFFINQGLLVSRDVTLLVETRT